MLSKFFALVTLAGLAGPILTSPALAADPTEWHATTPSELDYAVVAPYCMDHEVQIQAPPQAVFKVLTDSNWGDWFVDFRSVEWTSPAPHGRGSTRTVRLKDLAVKERFLAWVPNQRFSFSIDAVSLPLLEGMMEDMQLTPTQNGQATRFRWRVYYTPSPLMAAVRPVAEPMFDGMFKQSLLNLKAYAEKQPY